MPDQPQIRQKAAAGRDAYVAGRDLIVNVGGAGAATLGIPGLLPRDVPGFTGREGELARLVGLADGGRVVVTAIGGTAGVGKTALAVHAPTSWPMSSPMGTCTRTCTGTRRGRTRPSRVRCWRRSCAASGCPLRRCPPRWRSGRGCCGRCWLRGEC